jgi:hypothetical protein
MRCPPLSDGDYNGKYSDSGGCECLKILDPHGHELIPLDSGKKKFNASTEALWYHVTDALQYHRKKKKRTDATSIDVLNRLTREAVRTETKEALKFSVTPSSSTIRRELWPIARLTALRTRHAKTEPKDETRPIVLVEWQGCFLVIDGNTRINKWRKEGQTGFHSVIIIAPSAP